MGIGDRIKLKRKENKITQSELGKKVNASPQVVSNWERGYTDPNYDDVARLAEALNCSADYLLGKTNNSNKVNKTEPINSAFYNFDKLTDEEKDYLDLQLELFRDMKKKNKK